VKIVRRIRNGSGSPPARIFRLAFLILLLWSAGARADEARALRIVANGRCPSSDDVAQEVRRLLPAFDVSSAAAEAQSQNDAVLTEEPAGVTVAVSGQIRYFDDPTLRCTERARLAAVFVAVVLDPPRFVLPPPEATVVATPPPVRAPAPPSEWHLDLELGPASQMAAAGDWQNVPLAAGGSARLLWGKTLRLALGATVQTATTLQFGRADVRGQWIPIDVGARLQHAGEHWDAGVELSFVLAPVHLRGAGSNLSPAEEGWRVETGLRLGAAARYWVGKTVGVFISVFSSAFPRPYTLGVRDLGTVGETPTLWLGASLGLAVRLH
jgi:hypothetical protein